MFCHHCGNELPEGAGFCPVCGKPVIGDPKKAGTAGAASGASGAAETAGASSDASKTQEQEFAEFQQKMDAAMDKVSAAADYAVGAAVGTAKDVLDQVDQAVDSAISDVKADFSSSPAPGAPGGPLKTDRSLVVYILLSIVTCGIYGYYFIYSVAKDVNVACSDDDEQTAGLGAFILLSIVTCGLYGLYWEYRLGNRLAKNGPAYGLNIQENGTTILLWRIFGSLLCWVGTFVGSHILIRNVNQICDAYNRRYGY